uniref:WAP domain-containing protein n=1 Tax=Steinernema glaseri TaxID=37863 RepID=A0A1I7Z3L2_9BILA
MSVFGLLFASIVVVVVGGSVVRDLGHPVPSGDIEYTLQCPQCYSEKKGKDGKYRCVREPDCCLPREHKINCVVNPCLFFQKSCKEAAYCVPVPCGPDYCTNELYDLNYDLIDFNYCNKTSDTSRTRIHTNKSKQIVLVRRAQTQPAVIRHMKVFDTTRFHMKPGGCSQRREIIKVCVNECTYDRECPGRQRCCSNGCARRCMQATPHHPHNYLNFPITIVRRHN